MRRCGVCRARIGPTAEIMRLLDDQVVHLVHRRCVRARAADDMTHVRRVVIVRAGAIDVYRRIGGSRSRSVVSREH